MDEEPRRTGPIAGKGALKKLLGRNIPGPDVKGRWSDYTRVITCALCGNQVSVRDWIWGAHKFQATVCQPCADRWDARRGDYSKPPAKKPADERQINSPYKED